MYILTHAGIKRKYVLLTRPLFGYTASNDDIPTVITQVTNSILGTVEIYVILHALYILPDKTLYSQYVHL